VHSVPAAWCVVRRILTAAILPGVLLWCAVGQAEPAQVQQQIYLPDPTPRPPDLQRQYGDDPVSRARQQQIALIRKEQRRQEILTATDRLILLAAELRDETVKHETGSSMKARAVKAEEIEKLAKKVKEDSKLQ
jgi:hypothetical protein